MKIYILKVPEKLQPQSQKFRYPSHNDDYGVEQDFLIWLERHSELLTDNPHNATWHYLPVFWTRWHINHNFAVNNEGLEELQKEVEKVMLDPPSTFTITQYDGGTLLQSRNILEFTAARTTNDGIDIPILCSKHQLPLFGIAKKHLASFNGTFSTHPLREEMCSRFYGRQEIIIEGNVPTRFYKRWLLGKQYNLNVLASYIALCPRGTSCSSFRFFEAMQLGVAPCLIGDSDVRPFRKFVDWDSLSYYAPNISALEELLNSLDKDEAIQKGKRAKAFFEKELFYQKWCKYVIRELEGFSSSTTTSTPTTT